MPCNCFALQLNVHLHQCLHGVRVAVVVCVSAAANRMGERITWRSRVTQLIVTLVCVAHFIYGLYNIECFCTQTKRTHSLALSLFSSAACVEARRASCLRMSVTRIRTRTHRHALAHALRLSGRGWSIRCSNGGGGACNENICTRRQRRRRRLSASVGTCRQCTHVSRPKHKFDNTTTYLV